MLQNKLGIMNSVELARAEEKISKTKAIALFETGVLNRLTPGTFATLAKIHAYLFDEIYNFAGKVRDVNIAKENFRFAPVMYLDAALKHIDGMSQSTFDEIIEKYVEMNIAHLFREGNGRSTRIWLDLILKKELKQVVDWSQVDKEDYLLAMERSPIKDIEIKHLLKEALTSKVNDRDVYMKGIDASYYYEGYIVYKTEKLREGKNDQ
jgi:cell filamentation protein